MNMKNDFFIGVVPVKKNSNRFPGKILKLLMMNHYFGTL